MPAKLFTSYLSELNNIFSTINLKEYEDFVHELSEAYERDSNIIVFGNGGSASTASHFACDINKGVSFGNKKRFKVLCLNDNIPTMLAYANDLSYDLVFVEQLKNVMVKDDLVIGISGSGNSKNIIKAIEYANENEGKTFGICGFGGGRLKQVSQKSVAIASTDMQKVEDLHIIIIHSVMQLFSKKVEKGIH